MTFPCPLTHTKPPTVKKEVGWQSLTQTYIPETPQQFLFTLLSTTIERSLCLYKQTKSNTFIIVDNIAIRHNICHLPPESM